MGLSEIEGRPNRYPSGTRSASLSAPAPCRTVRRRKRRADIVAADFPHLRAGFQEPSVRPLSTRPICIRLFRKAMEQEVLRAGNSSMIRGTMSSPVSPLAKSTRAVLLGPRTDDESNAARICTPVENLRAPRRVQLDADLELQIGILRAKWLVESGLPLSLTRVRVHRPKVVLGVLIVVLRLYLVPGQGFGASQDQIALVALLCALRVPCLRVVPQILAASSGWPVLPPIWIDLYSSHCS